MAWTRLEDDVPLQLSLQWLSGSMWVSSRAYPRELVFLSAWSQGSARFRVEMQRSLATRGGQDARNRRREDGFTWGDSGQINPP